MNSDDVVALDDHDCDHDGDRDEEKIENERSSIRSNASMMGSMNKEVERKVCLGDQRKQKQRGNANECERGIVLQRKFTADSLDLENSNSRSSSEVDAVDCENSNRGTSTDRDEEGEGEGGEEEEKIYYRAVTKIEKKNLRKERSAMNDLKSIANYNNNNNNIISNNVRDNLLNAVILLDMDVRQSSPPFSFSFSFSSSSEKTKGQLSPRTTTPIKSLRDLVESAIERSRDYFVHCETDEEWSRVCKALSSSIFLEDSNDCVVTSSVQANNNVLIIPINAKDCVLKSARLVIIARAKTFVLSSFSPKQSFSKEESCMHKFVVLCISDAFRLHKQTKNSHATAGTIATLFISTKFYIQALASKSVDEFQQAMRSFIQRNEEGNGKGGNIRRKFSYLEETTDIEDNDARLRCCRSSLFFAGILHDFNRVVKKRYLSDFTDAFVDRKTFVRACHTIIWLFFNTTVPCLAVGLVFTIDSEERVGVEKFLTSEALANLAFSLVGGQSALVFRVTGPTLAFMQVIRITAFRLNAPLETFYSIVALVSGLVSMLFASFGGASTIKYVGLFFAEIMRMFVAIIFVFSSISAIRNKGVKTADTVAEFLKYFILHIGTFALSRKIKSLKDSPFLKSRIRRIIGDLAPAIGLIVFTGVSYIAKDVPVDRVHDEQYKMSGTMWPDYNPLKYADEIMSGKSIAIAIFCGVSLSIQIFLEGQISAVLSARPENKLKKGKSYHYDYFVVGFINALQGLFGLPIALPSLPHSPMHARISSEVVEYEEDYVSKTHVVRATEIGRFTNICASILRLFSLGLFRNALYGDIPVPVVSGFLLFMGYTALEENDIWKRFLLMFTQREQINHRQEERFRFVRLGVINAYTITQIFCFALVFTISRSYDFDKNRTLPVATFYPFVFLFVIGFATFILPMVFAESDLRILTKVSSKRLYSQLFC